MKINTEELRVKLMELAEGVVSAQDAAYFADEVIEAHIRKSPRSNILKSAVTDVDASISKKNTPIAYDVDLPSYISINFHGHGPLTYIKRIHDELESRANKNGIATAAFTNGQSMHTLHTWVQGLAKRGLVAIAVCNGGPRSVIPFNGTKGIFGTNPMAYGFPGENENIFCVDMATSEIPYFEILNAEKNSEPLRERSAVDSEGNFTRDAKEALDYSVSKTDPTSNLTPIGAGYKGYYIVYLMELLTSALIGMPSSPEMSTNFVAEEHGAILIVMSPKAFGTVQSFNSSIKALNSSVKSQKPKTGEQIILPGEGNNTRFAQGLDTIEINDDLARRLGFPS